MFSNKNLHVCQVKGQKKTLGLLEWDFQMIRWYEQPRVLGVEQE